MQSSSSVSQDCNREKGAGGPGQTLRSLQRDDTVWLALLLVAGAAVLYAAGAGALRVIPMGSLRFLLQTDVVGSMLLAFVAFVVCTNIGRVI